MFKVFRIVFALAAAALIVACVFIGIFAGMVPFWCCVGGAVLLFALSMLFKYLQEEREKKDAPAAPAIPAVPAVPAATPDTDGAEADGSRTADGGANGQNKGKGEAAEADAPAAGGSAARGGEPTQTDKP